MLTLFRSSSGNLAVLAILIVLAGCTGADAAQNPLAPPDLSSPRATLENFIELMNRAHRHWMSEDATDEARDERAAVDRVAHRFFDLNEVAPSVRKNVGRETAVYLKEVLDRVELPPVEQIPDSEAVAAAHLTRWTVPQTEIMLTRVSEGLREGDWVFSSEMDERAAEFYARAKKMPYRPGATEGLYDLFVSEPGWMIPRGLIRALPQWMQTRHGGQALWQWTGLVLTLLATAAVMFLIYRTSSQWSRTHRGTRYYLAAAFTIFAVAVPQLATDFLSDQIFITGRLFEIVDFALDLVSLAAFVVVILSLTNRLATALTALPWSHDRKLTGQLTQLTVRAIGVSGALIAVFEGGRYLGVPLTTLVAGVSVSGLTVALAAQDTLKNLFGSVMILLDRPFQVGDLIKIKSYEGKVESIGLRSTRIRDLSGHVISISNEEMARLDSKNISSRHHLRRHEVLRLRSDTPPPVIRDFAAFVRQLLAQRDGLDPIFTRVEVGFGDDAVSLSITYHFASQDTAAFRTFNEDITLRVLERMAQDGIRLASVIPRVETVSQAAHDGHGAHGGLEHHEQHEGGVPASGGAAHHE